MATKNKNCNTYFLQRLTKKEIWEIHRKAVCSDILKKCEINKKTGDCIFFEGGWGDGNEHIYTRYEYSDFSLRSPDTYGSETEMQQEYFKCMAERFGKEYIIAYMRLHTGLPEEFFANIINS